ncbi:uncharacterized protein LOC125504796 [Dendroctonus ponderosae]|uniref:uncharacterized protein LOC125504796 n=1 Tax=Dendroctonus ponderosae TaxID=77166 RepID=UPI0020360D21|nr:uncharacterized protein LOC125504796 [Dendroctonus ponderosae]
MFKASFRSIFICSRHFHDVCFKAHGRLILNCLRTKGLPGFQGAPSKENSFYREGVAYAQGCVTPVKNLPAESGTSEGEGCTQWSPLEGVTKPAKVYPGKRRLVQPIANICDIAGPAYDYVGPSNIATIPCTNTTFAKEGTLLPETVAPPTQEFCSQREFKGGVNVRASASTAFTGAKERSAAVPSGKVPYHQFINMKSQHPNVIQYGVPGGLYINWLHSLNCPLGTKYIRGICRRVFYDNIKTISC